MRCKVSDICHHWDKNKRYLLTLIDFLAAVNVDQRKYLLFLSQRWQLPKNLHLTTNNFHNKMFEFFNRRGSIKIKILQVINASHYSVRLIEHSESDLWSESSWKKLPNNYAIIGFKLASHFSNRANRWVYFFLCVVQLLKEILMVIIDICGHFKIGNYMAGQNQGTWLLWKLKLTASSEEHPWLKLLPGMKNVILLRSKFFW